MNTIEINEFKNLPFGENVTQSAAISPVENGIEYEILSDNESLEYVDYLNMSKVIEVLAEFFDVNASAIAKESQICAVALGSSALNAFEKVIDCDPLSLSGGTIGFSKEVTEDIAKQITAMKVRNLVAVNFDKKAIDFLIKNSDINVIQVKSL